MGSPLSLKKSINERFIIFIEDTLKKNKSASASVQFCHPAGKLQLPISFYNFKICKVCGGTTDMSILKLDTCSFPL